MRRRKRAGMVTMFVMVALVAILMVGVGSALADPPAKDPFGGPPADEAPFLCPAVGAGVLNAPFMTILGPIAGGQYSFLPGNNQAGAHANSHALNEVGPGQVGSNGLAGPGKGNSAWSPIWPNH